MENHYLRFTWMVLEIKKDARRVAKASEVNHNRGTQLRLITSEDAKLKYCGLIRMSMEVDPVAARIFAVRKALPADRLRFYIPDSDEDTDIQYLAILLRLHDASAVGSGDLAHDDLVDSVNEILFGVQGKALPDDVMESRLRSLERWGSIEKFPETQNVDLRAWRRSYTRYRITADGGFVNDTLLSAVRRKERRVNNQDALNALGGIETSLAEIRTKLASLSGDAKERASTLIDAYLTLARIVKTDYENLNEYLRDLNRRIIAFTTRRDLDYDDLEVILQRLEAYMEGIHSTFRSRSLAILRRCEELRDNECWENLLLGYELTVQNDERTRFDATETLRPNPDELLRRLTEFFDPSRKQSLVKEVATIRGNTVRIVASIRDHWQRLMERSSFVQQLEKAWTVIETTPLDDRDAWNSIQVWGSQLFGLQRIRTAPGLGTAEAAGKPPQPRRRYTRRTDVARTVTLQERKGTIEQVRRIEEELGMSLNDLVHQHILRGRKKARLSDFSLKSHEDFRRLIALAKHSELVLNTAIAKSYFSFRVSYVPQAPRVKWQRDGMTYEGPELEFQDAPTQVQYA